MQSCKKFQNLIESVCQI